MTKKQSNADPTFRKPPPPPTPPKRNSMTDTATDLCLENMMALRIDFIRAYNVLYYELNMKKDETHTALDRTEKRIIQLSDSIKALELN